MYMHAYMYINSSYMYMYNAYDTDVGLVHLLQALYWTVNDYSDYESKIKCKVHCTFIHAITHNYFREKKSLKVL